MADWIEVTDGLPVPVLDDLSHRERELVDAARRGDELVCGDVAIDDLRVSDDPALLVRAEVVRELLLGRRGPLDPRGVRLRGARLVGHLDLNHIASEVGVQLTRCVVAQPITAKDARLSWLDLSGSRLHSLLAKRMHVAGSLLLEGLRMSGSNESMICLLGARIGGELVLNGAQVTNDAGPALSADRLAADGPVRLDGARLSGAGKLGTVRLHSARIGGQLILNGAEIIHGTGPAFDADGLQTDGDVRFGGVRLSGAGDLGTIRLLGARIGGDIILVGAEVTTDAGPVFLADGLKAEGSVRLDDAHLSGSGDDGTIRLYGASIRGDLSLDDAEITNDAGPALQADGCQVDGDASLDDVHLSGVGEPGTIRLLNARVGGDLLLHTAAVTNHAGPALGADGLHVNGSIRLDGARLDGVGEIGTIRLLGARIGGQLILNGAEVTNPSGPALSADRLQTDSDLGIDDAHLFGAAETGTISVQGARIGGRLSLDGAEVTNDAGLVLSGDGLHVDSDIGLRGARLSSASDVGAVRLHGARVGSDVVLTSVEVTNDVGPALSADRLHTDGSVRLDGARLSGASELGTIHLLNACIGGDLDLEDAKVINDAGPAFGVDGLQTVGSVRLHRTHLSGAGEIGAIRMHGARIEGQLVLTDTEVTNATGPIIDLEDATIRALLIEPRVVCPTPTSGTSRCPQSARLNLDGFTFHALGRITWWEWLHTIRCHTSTYRPQPYQQLAAAERAAGHDGNARRILITQQRDLHKRAPVALGGWWTRLFHWLWGVLAGYGYRVRRTAVALLLTLVVAGAIGFWAGHVITAPGHHAVERPNSFTHRTGQPCSTVELIGLGLDRGLPLSPTGIRARCDLNTATTWGQTFTVAIWLVQAAVWSLATLALAGYTGLIRKPT